MDMEELSESTPAAAAKETDHLERLPVHDLYFLVYSVRHVNELLLLIRRERDIKRGSFFAEGLPRDISFLHIRTIGLKYLNSVITAVSQINQAIIGNRDSVRSVELRRPLPFEG